MAIGYKGFSTIGKEYANGYTLSGIDLVKQDILNHFNIRRGEKLHNPTFGTIIWDMLYAPMTEMSIQAIQEDIEAIVNYDPRVSVDNIVIKQYEHGLLVEVSMTYIPEQTMERLLLNFDADNTNLTLSEI